MALADTLDFCYRMTEASGANRVDILGNAPTLANNGTVGASTALARIRNRAAANCANWASQNASNFLSCADDATNRLNDDKVEMAVWASGYRSGFTDALLCKGNGATIDWLLAWRSTDKWMFQMFSPGGTQQILDHTGGGSAGTKVLVRIRTDPAQNKIGIATNLGAFNWIDVEDGGCRNTASATLNVGRLTSAANGWVGSANGYILKRGDWLTDAEAAFLVFGGFGAMPDDNGDFGDSELSVVHQAAMGGDRPDTVIFRCAAITTKLISGVEHQVWGLYIPNGSDAWVVLQHRTRTPGGAWGAITTYTYDGTGGLPELEITAPFDGHEVISLEILDDNYLCFKFGVHDAPIRLHYSDAPITSWTGGLSAEINEFGRTFVDATYPKLWRNLSDAVYGMLREGSSGDGDWYFNKYAGSQAFAAVAGTSTDGLLHQGTASGTENDRSWYPDEEPAIDPDNGRMWFSGTLRTASGGLTNKDVILFYYDPATTSFKKPDGTSQTVPVTLANAYVVYDSGARTVFNDGRITLDGNGNPHGAIIVEDADGNLEILHWWYDLATDTPGSEWLTDYNTPVANYLKWSRSGIHWDYATNKLLVWYKHQDDGEDGYRQIKSGAGAFNTWGAPTVLFNWGNLGRYELAWDRYQLRVNRELYAPVIDAQTNAARPMMLMSLELEAVPAPSVTSITPDEAAQGGTGNFTVAGTGFVDGAAATFSGTGITVNSTTWVSSTELTVNITVAGDATLSARDLTVTNPDEQDDTLVGAMTITEAPGGTLLKRLLIEGNFTATWL